MKHALRIFGVGLVFFSGVTPSFPLLGKPVGSCKHSRGKQASLELRFFIMLPGEFISSCWYQQLRHGIAQSLVLLLMGGKENCCLRSFIIFRREEFIIGVFLDDLFHVR
jgi:hypothetical protein